MWPLTLRSGSFKGITLNEFSENRLLKKQLTKMNKTLQKHHQQPQRGFDDPTSKVIYLQTYIGHQHCHEYIQSQCLWACIQNTILLSKSTNQPLKCHLLIWILQNVIDLSQKEDSYLKRYQTLFFYSQTNCLILIAGFKHFVVLHQVQGNRNRFWDMWQIKGIILSITVTAISIHPSNFIPKLPIQVMQKLICCWHIFCRRQRTLKLLCRFLSVFLWFMVFFLPLWPWELPNLDTAL